MFKKNFYNYRSFFLSILINVGINIPLILKFGAIGASFATMTAGLITGIIHLIISQHYYKIDYEWGKISYIMGIFIFGSIIIVSMFLFKIYYPFVVLIKIFFLVIFIYIGIIFKILSKENFSLIFKNIRNLSKFQKNSNLL